LTTGEAEAVPLLLPKELFPENAVEARERKDILKGDVRRAILNKN